MVEQTNLLNYFVDRCTNTITDSNLFIIYNLLEFGIFFKKKIELKIRSHVFLK